MKKPLIKVECLPRKLEVLSSNPSTAPTKKEEFRFLLVSYISCIP
jgi:hypothetical protein